jgi:hypothetical protein
MLTKFKPILKEWNPQFLREIKGRLSSRNIIIAVVIAGIVQILIYFYFSSHIPLSVDMYSLEELKSGVSNRYCQKSISSSYECFQDINGNWKLNWELWWLDVFIAISILCIFALIVGGSYLLIADLSREERRGTLNFIRLSPQSAKSIFVGKMLGVPIIIYAIVVLILPFNLLSGLSAHIPLGLILAFYAIVAVSCAFFYSIALLFSLVSTGLCGFQSWLGSGAIAGFLYLTFMGIRSDIFIEDLTIFNWFYQFNPIIFLPYLTHATKISADIIAAFVLEKNYKGLAQLQWYGQSFWLNAIGGMTFMLLHFGWWIYWFGQGLKRRFHNPSKSIWSKGQSYLIFSGFVIISLGFCLQSPESRDYYYNFGWAQILVLLLLLILIANLTPHRQTLQDWSRYRHKMNDRRRSLWQDLVWGEKSPAIVAIALNLIILIVLMLPFVLLAPVNEYRMPTIYGLFLESGIVLIYASIAQLILLMKTSKRVTIAIAVIASLVILPLAYFIVAGVETKQLVWVWMFTAFPVVATENVSIATIALAIFFQGLAIAVLNLRLSYLLQEVGESSTKTLLLNKTRVS